MEKRGEQHVQEGALRTDAVLRVLRQRSREHEDALHVQGSNICRSPVDSEGTALKYHATCHRASNKKRITSVVKQASHDGKQAFASTVLDITAGRQQHVARAASQTAGLWAGLLREVEASENGSPELFWVRGFLQS